MQYRLHSGGRELENLGEARHTLLYAHSICHSIQTAVASLQQLNGLTAVVGAACKGIQDGCNACERHLENGPAMCGAPLRGGAIQVAILTLNQRIDKIALVEFGENADVGVGGGYVTGLRASHHDTVDVR